ncbi:MAG: TIGR03936 family radical SAM-associated protein [Actinomycetota bacterium]|nr:TIGR03936 family radical SAM-associated protein [Actinomycetota bacterium]
MEDFLVLRVQLAKIGPMRFLSHADFSRLIMMAVRRAKLPLAYTGKYRKRMKISMSPPIPIGVESNCEYFDLFLRSYISPAEAEKRLSSSLPRGVHVVRSKLCGSGTKAVGRLIDTAKYTVFVPEGFCTKRELERAVKLFLERDSVRCERVQPRKTKIVDIRKGVHLLEVETNEEGLGIIMILDDGIAGTVKPLEVLESLLSHVDVPLEKIGEFRVKREGLYMRRGNRLVSPMDVNVLTTDVKKPKKVSGREE